MKSIINTGTILSIVFAMVLFSCEENEIMPSYKKVGTAYQTVASVAVSTTTPAQNDIVTITIKYVNINSDPLSRISVKIKENAGAYAEVASIDESDSGTAEEITVTYPYTVTQTAGTAVGIQIELFSEKEFPQLLRASLTVQ